MAKQTAVSEPCGGQDIDEILKILDHMGAGNTLVGLKAGEAGDGIGYTENSVKSKKELILEKAVVKQKGIINVLTQKLEKMKKNA